MIKGGTTFGKAGLLPYCQPSFRVKGGRKFDDFLLNRNLSL
jgi:hypothetical protein